MGSYISNIDRCTEPCSGTVKTSIDIIEDTMIGAGRFVNQLMEICNMHYDLNTMTIERSRRIFAREDKKVDFNIKKVIFNNPATIVYWKDGTKTVVKCGKDDTFDAEKGLALCFMKKALGNKGNFNNTIKEYIK